MWSGTGTPASETQVSPMMVPVPVNGEVGGSPTPPTSTVMGLDALSSSMLSPTW